MCLSFPTADMGWGIRESAQGQLGLHRVDVAPPRWKHCLLHGNESCGFQHPARIALSREGERVALGMCLGMPMSVHTVPSAACSTKPARWQQAFQVSLSPQKNRASAWLNNAFIKRRQ